MPSNSTCTRSSPRRTGSGCGERPAPGGAGSEARAEDPGGGQGLTVLHGLQPRGARVRSGGCRWPRAVQPVPSAGLRYRAPDRDAAPRPVEQRRAPAAAPMACHPARPADMFPGCHRRCRDAQRRHQGDPGGGPRRADGVRDPAARAVVFHADARRTSEMDGSARLRSRG